jgi:hypothetical protein
MREERRDDLVDLPAVGVQAQVLVLLVAADQRVDRIALKALRDGAQLGLVEALGDQQVLADPDLMTAASSASRAWTEVGQCGLCSSVSVGASDTPRILRRAQRGGSTTGAPSGTSVFCTHATSCQAPSLYPTLR